MEFLHPIKIIIADDHQIIRDGLSILLSKINNIEILGNAANGEELIEKVRSQNPDIVLTDIQMPVMDGIEAARILLRENESLGIIALTMHEETNYIVDTVEAGVRGYLLKNTSKSELLKAINMVHEGDTYFCKEATDKLVSLVSKTNFYPLKPNDKPVFTKQELQIIQLICQQFSSKEIAATLDMSKRQVDSLREKIQKKIGARNLAGIVMYAIRNGIFSID
jgi:DNA-binding NarL/FixJ family response regulator